MNIKLKENNQQGFTLIEIVIGLVFFSMLSYFSYTLMFMSARRSAAVSKKNETVTALLSAAGRLRRDIKWASEIKIERDGRQVTFIGTDKSKRFWYFDSKTRELQLPSITNPSKQVRFALARFRGFKVWKVNNSSNYKWLLAALPMDQGNGRVSKNDLKYSTTVAGETCMRTAMGTSMFPLLAGE